MLQNDIADGNTIKGPTGEFQVGGSLAGSHGSFVVLVDPDSELGVLVLAANLVENDNWTLVNRISANGAAQIEETSAAAAQASEVQRLQKIVDGLVAQQNQPAQAETVDPVTTVPDEPVPTPDTAPVIQPGLTTPEV